MKWASDNYVRVKKQQGVYFVHLVLERLLRKDSLPLGQSENEHEARVLAIAESTARGVSCRLEDEDHK